MSWIWLHMQATLFFLVSQALWQIGSIWVVVRTLVCCFCRGADVRATPLVLSMWPCKLKLDREKSKHAGFALQNGFSPAFLHSLRLVKDIVKPNTCQSVINMIWLLLPISDWPIITIAWGGLLLVVSHLFAVPVLVWQVGLDESK